jgi:hypothetical protein
MLPWYIEFGYPKTMCQSFLSLYLEANQVMTRLLMLPYLSGILQFHITEDVTTSRVKSIALTMPFSYVIEIHLNSLFQLTKYWFICKMDQY